MAIKHSFTGNAFGPDTDGTCGCSTSDAVQRLLLASMFIVHKIQMGKGICMEDINVDVHLYAR